jgi:hypothetical protein
MSRRKRNRLPVTQELLEGLETLFPDRLPSEPPSSLEIARLVGQQQVIRKLRDEFEKQYEEHVRS